MPASEFSRILHALGLTQRQAGAVLGVGDRTIRSWLTGERAVPEPVAKLLRLITAGRVSVETVRDS